MLGTLAWTGQAQALEPLSEFLSAARTGSFDSREQRAALAAREWDANAATGRLLPTLTARGAYTHNQYEAGIPAGTFPGQTSPLTITPRDQLDGTLQLDVPIIDLSAWARRSQAQHLVRAEEANQEVTFNNVDRAVAQAYFSLLGASALVGASEASIALARDNLSYVTTRRQLGAATELDEARAQANLERAMQDQANAELLRITSARQLETLSTLTPSAVTDYPIDDLHEEAPLATWFAQSDNPRERAQKERTLAVEAGAAAQRRALLPTLSASAQERITNATGFAGRNASYTLSAILSWRLDYATYAAGKGQNAQAELEAIRGERTERAVEDSIFEAYHRVNASIASSAAARAQAEAARRAAELASISYQAGAATQLDVVVSQREAFAAQAARIQADADLAFARVALRLAAGQPATATDGSSTRSPNANGEAR